MEDFRSKSQTDTKSQLEINGNTNFRSYSTNHASSSSSSSYSGNNGKTEITVAEGGGGGGDPPRKVLKKGRSIGGLNDPELQRMRRVASYKVYAVEGKLKGSVKKSFRFFKDKCNQMLYGHK